MLLNFNCQSQSAHPIKITYSCKSTSLEAVLDHLSKTAGVYFVYSSDKIAITTPVSLSVKAKPLNEVLSLLGRQLNLIFKIQEHHVIVKAVHRLSVTKRAFVVASGKTDDKTLATVKAPGITDSISERYASRDLVPLPIPRNITDLLPSDYMEKQFVKLRPYFDTAILKRMSVQYIRQLNSNNLDRCWFISFGPTLNDYSGGFELQAGLRQVYAVFAPTWLKSGEFHAAYGLGASLPLPGNFFLNPVYSFAKLSQSEIISTTGAMPYREDQTVNHHQMKLMLQYAVSKNISIRIGPAFNQVKTTYKYQYPETGPVPVNNAQVFQRSATVAGPDKVPYGFNPPVASGSVMKSVPTLRTNNFDFGWEASLSYKINFFRKP